MSILNSRTDKPDEDTPDIELDFILMNQPDHERETLQLGELTVLEKILSFKGYFYGLCMAFCMSMSLIFIKLGYTLEGSEHAVIRYSIQLVLMGIVVKYKGINYFKYEMSVLKWLIARGLIGSTTIIIGLFAVGLLDPSDVSTLTNLTIITTAIIARFILKEKLSLVHFLAALLSITGVLFVVRPAFLFGQLDDLRTNIMNNNSSLNSTTNLSTGDDPENDSWKKVVGVVLILFTTLLSGSTNVTIKKLCNIKIHYSLSSSYPALMGLPISVVISVCIFFAGSSHTDFASEKDKILLHMGYSVCSALFANCALILLNLALEVEDASKIAIVKTSDVAFAFILQYLILNVEFHMFGLIGAAFIMSATLLIVVFRIVEKKCGTEKPCLGRVMFYKF